MVAWPDWWDWELDVSPHLLKRMLDRGFSDTDVRLMLATASGVIQNHEPRRWVALTSHDGNPWHVILEPDPTDRLLVVITAYRVNP